MEKNAIAVLDNFNAVLVNADADNNFGLNNVVKMIRLTDLEISLVDRLREREGLYIYDVETDAYKAVKPLSVIVSDDVKMREKQSHLLEIGLIMRYRRVQL